MKNQEVAELKNKIQSLKQQVRESERQLEEIREKCTHRYHKLPTLSWGRDSVDSGIDTRLGGYYSSDKSECEICGKIC